MQTDQTDTALTGEERDSREAQHARWDAMTALELAQEIQHLARRLEHPPSLDGMFGQRPYEFYQLPEACQLRVRETQSAVYSLVSKLRTEQNAVDRRDQAALARLAAADPECRAAVAGLVVVESDARQGALHLARAHAIKTFCGKRIPPSRLRQPLEPGWAADGVDCANCLKPFVARGILFGSAFRPESRGGRYAEGGNWFDLVAVSS